MTETTQEQARRLADYILACTGPRQREVLLEVLTAREPCPCGQWSVASLDIATPAPSPPAPVTDDERCPGGMKLGWDACPKCGATMDDDCKGAPAAKPGAEVTARLVRALRKHDALEFPTAADSLMQEAAALIESLERQVTLADASIKAMSRQLEKCADDNVAISKLRDRAEARVSELEGALGALVSDRHGHPALCACPWCRARALLTPPAQIKGED